MCCLSNVLRGLSHEAMKLRVGLKEGGRERVREQRWRVRGQRWRATDRCSINRRRRPRRPSVPILTNPKIHLLRHLHPHHHVPLRPPGRSRRRRRRLPGRPSGPIPPRGSLLSPPLFPKLVESESDEFQVNHSRDSRDHTPSPELVLLFWPQNK